MKRLVFLIHRAKKRLEIAMNDNVQKFISEDLQLQYLPCTILLIENWFRVDRSHELYNHSKDYVGSPVPYRSGCQAQYKSLSNPVAAHLRSEQQQLSRDTLGISHVLLTSMGLTAENHSQLLFGRLPPSSSSKYAVA